MFINPNFFKFGRFKLQSMDDLSTKFQPPESVCIVFMLFSKQIQMLSSTLKAHLHHTSRKIVNDSHTILLGDLPDLSCDCCLQFIFILKPKRADDAMFRKGYPCPWMS